MRASVCLLSLMVLCGCGRSLQEAEGEADLRALLRTGYSTVVLPPGETQLRAPLEIPVSSRGLRLVGSRAGSTLKLAAGFQGSAAIVVRAADVSLSGFAIDGNRAALETRTGLPPSNVTFAEFQKANGILVPSCSRVSVSDVLFREVAGYAILASAVKDFVAARITVSASGSRGPGGKNNATGGVLIEDGSIGFEVRDSRFDGILGNGLWTHSRFTAARNRQGRFTGNWFVEVGRDALQAGHASGMYISRNRGRRVGFPASAVDIEAQAMPVAIDTAGNVDHSLYEDNHFEDVNGKCVDLDGFHDGAVRGNSCVNRMAAANYPHAGFGVLMNNFNPNMRPERVLITNNRIERFLFSGIYVTGRENLIVGNELLHLNLAHCNDNLSRYQCLFMAGQPDLLRSGIYLGPGPARPVRGGANRIVDNLVTGYGMSSNCVVYAPGVERTGDRVSGNVCREE